MLMPDQERNTRRKITEDQGDEDGIDKVSTGVHFETHFW